MKRERLRKNIDEKETKTAHEEVTSNSGNKEQRDVLENVWQEKPSSLEESRGDVFILLLKLLY